MKSNDRQRPSGAATAVIVILVLLIAAIIAAIAYLLWSDRDGDNVPLPESGSSVPQLEEESSSSEAAGIILDLKPDPLAQDGLVPEEEWPEKNEEGKFDFSINRTPYFETPESKGSLMIGNPPQNNYLMAVEIWLEDGVTLVYQSGTLKPNQCITDAPLSKTLEKGIYQAVACFTAIDPETMENLGTLETAITLQVGERIPS